MSQQPKVISLDELASRLAALPQDRRRLVALAGPPAAGKSTTATRLVEELNTAQPGIAAVVGMDGFHFDDTVLESMGRRQYKGAPDTFDLDGLQVMLERLRRDNGRPVAVPVFDRTIETARSAAQLVPPSVRLVIVEGNYLLLRRPGWRDLRHFFDVTASIEADFTVLRERLVRRWLDLGLSPQVAASKADSNDLPNAQLVIAESDRPDIVLSVGEGW
jgi:pantothenate kinase